MLTSPYLAAVLMAALNVEVAPLAGEAVSGELQSLTPQQVVVAAADGPRTFPLAALRSLQVTGAEEAPTGATVTVRLRDESLLRCTSFTTDDKANLSFAGLEVQGPVGAIHWAQLQSLDKEPAAQQVWEGLIDKPSEGDMLVFARMVDDQLVVENLSGTLYDVGPDEVDFLLGGDRVSPSRSKVIGLIYVPGRLEVKDRVATVKLTDGSTLSAAELQLGEESLQVTTGAGLQADVPLDRLMAVELGASNITYLSDLTPTSVECEPYFGVVLDSEKQAYLPRMDEDHHGELLKVPGRPPAAKGLALRTQTKLVYRLQKPYKKLRAVAGIAEHVLDSEVTPHLVLRISSDDDTLLEREVSGSDEPFDIDLDISGVQRLTIEVLYGNSQDIADYLHLCEARLLK